MKNSQLYHSLPHVRKVRRYLRRACQKFARPMKASRSNYILRDEQGRNLLKTRRWRNRIKTIVLVTVFGLIYINVNQ